MEGVDGVGRGPKFAAVAWLGWSAPSLPRVQCGAFLLCGEQFAFDNILIQRLRGNAMLTSTECRQRAEQTLAEADLHPRHERRLRSAVEGWLFLADEMKRVETTVARLAE
jgi:hypothetical protein